MAAERMAIEVRTRPALRVLVAELQRIASHCLWLGTWCMDMGGALGGGATVFLYCIREREWVLDLFEALVGARLLYGFHQVGGTRYDIPAGWAQKCRETITLIEKRILEYEDMLERNAFFQARTQGVGTISRELAQTVGISGPLIRGSGVSYDIRRLEPYSSYEDFDLSAGGDGGRLLRSLPRADGRVPRVHQYRAAGARRAAGGPGVLPTRCQVGGPGARRQG
jgi:NADH-quinone oxidoreductase subunit D